MGTVELILALALVFVMAAFVIQGWISQKQTIVLAREVQVLATILNRRATSLPTMSTFTEPDEKETKATATEPPSESQWT